ncbi:MAG: PKD domain-containing protein [Planctomycetota bacterium]|nr:PKD domain-containing protein [Planctomycetota bacterium]
MRVLAIGFGLVLGTLLLVSIGALVPPGPAPILGGVSAPVESAAIPAQVRHAAPLVVLSAKNKPESFVKLAERQADRARNIHENFEAAMNLAGALQKAGKPDAAVDDALRRAADFAECLPAGTLGANGRPTPFSGPEGGARTLLAQAHREIVHGEQAAARRHLELLLERYAEASPALAEQARADLARLDSGEQAAGAPRALAGAKEEKLLGNRKPATGNQQPVTVAAREVSPVQTTLVLATSEANTVIFSGAENGKTYTISAAGIWAQDPDPQFDTGPEGLASFGTISGGPFAGMFFGTFAAQEPGSGSWQAIGASGSITATADGEILGSFADILGLYGDNNGALFVTVSEEGFEPPPGATAPPLADARVSPDTACVHYASTNVALDGSLSADADAEGDAPALRWFHWRLVNLTNPAVRPLVYEGPDSFAFPSGLNQPGAYEVTLRVVDNEGELGTAVRTLTAVGIVFDPPSLEAEVGATATSNAEVIPASAADGISFEFSVPDVANFQATSAGAGVIEVQIEGVAEGSTELIAQVQGEFGPENCEFLYVSVVPPSIKTPPVAIAETTTPVICAGGTVTLDGSGSHDTDTVNDDQILPQIQNYAWTLVNLTDPGQPPITFSTPNAMTTTVLTAPGEYEATLVVTDNDGDPSLDGSSDAHATLIVVGVTFEPDVLAVEVGETELTVATVVPASAAGSVTFSLTDAAKASIPANLPAGAIVPIPVTGLTEGLTTLRAEVATGMGSEICATADIAVLPAPAGAVAAILDTEDNVLEFLGHKLDKLPVDSQGFGTVVSLQFGGGAAVAARASGLAPVELSDDRIDTLNVELSRNQDGFSERISLTETGADSLDFFSADGTVVARVTRPPGNDTKRIDTMELTLTSTRYLAIDTTFNLIETGKNTRTFRSPDRGLSVLFIGRPHANRRDLALAFVFDATARDLDPALLIETGKDTLDFRSANGKTRLVLPAGVEFDAHAADEFEARFSEARQGVSGAPLRLLESGADSLFFQTRGAGLSGSNEIVVRVEMSRDDASQGGTVANTIVATLSAGSQSIEVTLTRQPGIGDPVRYFSKAIKVGANETSRDEVAIQAAPGTKVTAQAAKPKDGALVISQRVAVYEAAILEPSTNVVVAGPNSTANIALLIGTGGTQTPDAESLEATMEISSGGELIRKLTGPVSLTDVAGVLAWDLTNEFAVFVPPGNYDITITVAPPGAPTASRAVSNTHTVTVVENLGKPKASIVDVDTYRVMVAKMAGVSPGSQNADVRIVISDLPPGQQALVTVEDLPGAGSCTIEDSRRIDPRTLLLPTGVHNGIKLQGDRLSKSRHDILVTVRDPVSKAVLASETFTSFWVALDSPPDFHGNGAPELPIEPNNGRFPLRENLFIRFLTRKPGFGILKLPAESVAHTGILVRGTIIPSGMVSTDFRIETSERDGFNFARKRTTRMWVESGPDICTSENPAGGGANVDNGDDDPDGDVSDEDLKPDRDGSERDLYIYSIDAPRVSSSQIIHNETLRFRGNFNTFTEYQSVRCSGDFVWFSRISVTKSPQGDLQSSSTFQHDNLNAPGITSLAPDLISTPPTVDFVIGAISPTAIAPSLPGPQVLDVISKAGTTFPPGMITVSLDKISGDGPDSIPLIGQPTRKAGDTIISVALDSAAIANSLRADYRVHVEIDGVGCQSFTSLIIGNRFWQNVALANDFDPITNKITGITVTFVPLNASGIPINLPADALPTIQPSPAFTTTGTIQAAGPVQVKANGVEFFRKFVLPPSTPPLSGGFVIECQGPASVPPIAPGYAPLLTYTEGQ